MAGADVLGLEPLELLLLAELVGLRKLVSPRRPLRRWGMVEIDGLAATCHFGISLFLLVGSKQRCKTSEWRFLTSSGGRGALDRAQSGALQRRRLSRYRGRPCFKANVLTDEIVMHLSDVAPRCNGSGPQRARPTPTPISQSLALLYSVRRTCTLQYSVRYLRSIPEYSSLQHLTSTKNFGAAPSEGLTLLRGDLLSPSASGKRRAPRTITTQVDCLNTPYPLSSGCSTKILTKKL